jgi:hypothetical protein
MNQERPVLYINILIHDASDLIKDEVAAKVKKSRIPGPLKESVANRAAARIAWDLSIANKVLDKLGPRLCQEIPIKMGRKGIQVHVETVHSEGNYLVQELQVQHVDAIVMAEARNKSAEKDREEGTLTSSLFKGMFTVIGVQNQASLEGGVLPTIVQRKVSVSICEMMQEKLAEKKMTADVRVLQEEKQARYFFNTLRIVRYETTQAEKAKRAMSPLRRLKVEPIHLSNVSTEKKVLITKCISSAVEAAAAADTRVKETSTIADRTKVAQTDETAKHSAIDSTPIKTGMSIAAITSSFGGSSMKVEADCANETKRRKKVLHRKSSSLSHAVEAAAASISATIKKGTSLSSSVDTVCKAGSKKSAQPNKSV